MIITIDGPVATGKSSVAKKLANAIGFIYFDTGAMYRAFTYGILKHKIDMDDPEALEKFISTFEVEIKIKHGERRYFVEEEDVTDIIRKDEVTSHVSMVSANSHVREKMVACQRALALGVNAVFDGRDMGSVVFPQADLKIFLTGRPEVRAKRRYDELKGKFPEEYKTLTLAKALDDLQARDKYDSERETSPLKMADDAYAVDTSDISVDDVVYQILEIKDTMKVRKEIV